MLDLLRQKFLEASMAESLLATGQRPLVNGSFAAGPFWGVCLADDGNWQGENMLGLLLMQVRTELRETQ